jgi:hypothetical protein
MSISKRIDVVERQKRRSRESHGHQELSRVNKVITAFFRSKKVSRCRGFDADA